MKKLELLIDRIFNCNDKMEYKLDKLKYQKVLIKKKYIKRLSSYLKTLRKLALNTKHEDEVYDLYNNFMEKYCKFIIKNDIELDLE